MSFYVDIFAILIILFVFFFYITNRKNAIKYVYLRFNIFLLITIISDIILKLYSQLSGSTPTTLILGRVFLSAVLLDAYFFFICSIDSCFKKINKSIIFNVLIGLILISGIVLAWVLPIEALVDGANNTYILGISLNVSYSISVFFIILAFLMVLINRKNIIRRKQLGVYIYTSFYLLSLLIQIIIDLVAKTDTKVYFGRIAQAIGSLFLYSIVENPDNDTDSYLNILNERALYRYIADNMNNRRENDIIIVSFDKNYYTTNDSFYDVLSKIYKKVSKYLYRIFKYDQYTYVIIRNKKHDDDIKRSIYKINSELMEFYKELASIHTCINVLPHNLKIDNSELSVIIAQITKSYVKFDNKIYIINNDDINNIRENIWISKEVDQAIAQDKVEVVYQCVYDIKNNKYISAEALVRLRDELNNIIYPDKFIDMVEKDGRIIDLSKLMFEHVCRFISRNDLKGLGLEYLEVNLSQAQLNDPKLLETYTTILKKYSVDPKFINLEITEITKGISQTALARMREFEEIGVTFSLDDFGKGNSNLNYVVSHPVDVVKFDRTMVESYFENNTTKLIVDYSIKMIKELGHKIVFEGVETKEQVDAIKKMDVDYIQGYYYSKPISELDLIQFLQNPIKTEE